MGSTKEKFTKKLERLFFEKRERERIKSVKIGAAILGFTSDEAEKIFKGRKGLEIECK